MLCLWFSENCQKIFLDKPNPVGVKFWPQPRGYGCLNKCI
nr:MAG TPA: hypothetical protein [Caudoviricetes sp.]